MPKRRPLGRPRTKGKQKSFKFSTTAASALSSIAGRFGWTHTTAAERAILFANVHPEFSGRMEVGK